MAQAPPVRTWRTLEKQRQSTSDNYITDPLPESQAGVMLLLEEFLIQRICAIEEQKNSLGRMVLVRSIKYVFNLELIEASISRFPDFVDGCALVPDQDTYAEPVPIGIIKQSLQSVTDISEDATPRTSGVDPSVKLKLGTAVLFDALPNAKGRHVGLKSRTQRLLNKLNPLKAKNRPHPASGDRQMKTVYSLERTPLRKELPDKKREDQSTTDTSLNAHENTLESVDLEAPGTAELVDCTNKNKWRNTLQKSVRGLRSASRLLLSDPAPADNEVERITPPLSLQISPISKYGFDNHYEYHSRKGENKKEYRPHQSRNEATKASLACSISDHVQDQHIQRSGTSSGGGQSWLSSNESAEALLAKTTDTSSESIKSWDHLRKASDYPDHTTLPPIPMSSSSESEMSSSGTSPQKREMRGTSWGRRTERALGDIAGPSATDSADRSSSAERMAIVDRYKLFANQRTVTRRVPSENILTSLYAMLDDAMPRSTPTASKSVDNLASLARESAVQPQAIHPLPSLHETADVITQRPMPSNSAENLVTLAEESAGQPEGHGSLSRVERAVEEAARILRQTSVGNPSKRSVVRTTVPRFEGNAVVPGRFTRYASGETNVFPEDGEVSLQQHLLKSTDDDEAADVLNGYEAESESSSNASVLVRQPESWS